MRRVVRSPAARNDIVNIAVHFGEVDLALMERFLNAAEATITYLAEHGDIAPFASLDAYPDIRRWPIKGFNQYLIFHITDENTLTIIRVMHGAQDVPRAIEDDLPEADDSPDES